MPTDTHFNRAGELIQEFKAIKPFLERFGIAITIAALQCGKPDVMSCERALKSVPDALNEMTVLKGIMAPSGVFRFFVL